MEALLLQETLRAARVIRPAQGPPQSNQVNVQGKRLSFRHKRGHPRVRLLGTHPFGNEAEAFSNPENMRVDREGLSPQAEKKQTVNGLRPHPVEVSEALFDRLGIRLR